MKYIISIILVLVVFVSQAQQGFECGAVMTVLETKKTSNLVKSLSVVNATSDPSLDIRDLRTWIPDCTSGKPLKNPPITYINVTFHVFLDDNGGNNRYADNAKLLALLDNINDVYSGSRNMREGGPSDKVIGVKQIEIKSELPNYDTRIRFTLGDNNERIYHYKDDSLNTTLSITKIKNYLKKENPEGFNKGIDFYFVASKNGSISAQASFPVSIVSSNSYVIVYNCGKPGDPNTEWIMQGTLAHELGHSFDLTHTYCGGGASAVGCESMKNIHKCNYTDHKYDDKEYLSDIFGPCESSTFPHLKGWVSPYDAKSKTNPNPEKYTNNIMGGTNSSRYISPMQAGQMHRALAIKSVGKYVKQGTYSDMPLVINKRVDWCENFVRLFRDITIEKGGYLTLDANYEMNQSCSIEIQNGGVLHFVANNTLKLNTSNKITIKKGGTLIISGNLDILGTGAIDVQSGGYLCVENTSKVNLADVLSVIRLHSGAKLGVNTTYVKNTGGYCASVGALSSKKTGNGKVVSSYSSDVYIQNKTFTTSAYFSGKNIYVNDVVVKSGCTIMLDAESEVYLNKNVDVQKGGSIETVGKY